MNWFEWVVAIFVSLFLLAGVCLTLFTILTLWWHKNFCQDKD
jgi:hypothetical protein